MGGIDLIMPVWEMRVRRESGADYFLSFTFTCDPKAVCGARGVLPWPLRRRHLCFNFLQIEHKAIL